MKASSMTDNGGPSTVLFAVAVLATLIANT